MLEIVAGKMDKTDRCAAEYPIKKWCSLLGLKQKKLISFLKVTENKLKTKVVYFGNIIRIEIPNLLNKRDNYTKDLVVAPKRLPSKEVEVEVEVEVDLEKELKEDIKKLKNEKKKEEAPPTSDKPKQATLTDAGFLTAIKKNPAYSHIDLDMELHRMDAWLLTPKGKNRSKTRRFIVAWLNKIDRPLPEVDRWAGIGGKQ